MNDVAIGAQKVDMKNFFTARNPKHEALLPSAFALLGLVLAVDVVDFQDTHVLGAAASALSAECFDGHSPIVCFGGHSDSGSFPSESVLSPPVVFPSSSRSDRNSVLGKDTAHGECAGAVKFGDLDRPFGLVKLNDFGVCEIRITAHRI